MQALAAHADIGVPEKQVDCPNNEIFSIYRADRYREAYASIANMPVHDELSLAAAFFASNRAMTFAGFKTMLNRHRYLRRMIAAHALQVITLIRRDIASTVASFIAATDTGVWNRAGEAQSHRFHFGRDHQRRVDAHLQYLLICFRLFALIPGTISLEFEALCENDFHDSRLDAYFERPIRLADPRPPVDGARYVENWPSFTRYIQRRIRQLRPRTPSF